MILSANIKNHQGHWGFRPCSQSVRRCSAIPLFPRRIYVLPLPHPSEPPFRGPLVLICQPASCLLPLFYFHLTVSAQHSIADSNTLVFFCLFFFFVDLYSAREQPTPECIWPRSGSDLDLADLAQPIRARSVRQAAVVRAMCVPKQHAPNSSMLS